MRRTTPRAAAAGTVRPHHALLGIGAQGLGGLATVLDVKVAASPCHAATLPVALILQLRGDALLVTVELDGSGPARPEPPPADTWDGTPAATTAPPGARGRPGPPGRRGGGAVAGWRDCGCAAVC
ncbi:fumarate hydratase [Cupriavidus basilensis]